MVVPETRFADVAKRRKKVYDCKALDNTSNEELWKGFFIQGVIIGIILCAPSPLLQHTQTCTHDLSH